MRRSLLSHGVCLFVGCTATLATMLWLQRGLGLAMAERRGARTPSGNGDVNGDGRIDQRDVVYLVRFLHARGPSPRPIECPPPGRPELPATGQTRCYDVDGLAIDCSSADYPGQDGAYQAGCPMEGRFVDNQDGTVTDTCTGLMWQKDTADVNGSGSVGDEDARDWQTALRYCDGLDFAGHDDWRLPSVRELLSIVDYGRVDPAIDPVFGAESHWYWSSSSGVGYSHPGLAWEIYFRNGICMNGAAQLNRLFIRAVRNAQ